MVPVLAVVGTSGSGKSTVVEFLVSNLSKVGLHVGTAKHVHYRGFSIDEEGKDTWRHSRAGARVVISCAPKEIAIIKKKNIGGDELERVLKLVKDEKLDLLIIEGFHSLIAKRTDVLKIVTAKDEEDMKRTLDGTVEPVLAITGPLATKKYFKTPRIAPVSDLDVDGEEILKIVKDAIKY